MDTKSTPKITRDGFIKILFTLCFHQYHKNYYVSDPDYPGCLIFFDLEAFKKILVIKVFNRNESEAFSFYSKNLDFYDNLFPVLRWIFAAPSLNEDWRKLSKFKRQRQLYSVNEYPGFYAETYTPEDPRYCERFQMHLYQIEYTTFLDTKQGQFALSNGKTLNLDWEVKYYTKNVLDTEHDENIRIEIKSKLAKWVLPFYLSKSNIPIDITNIIICFL
jgi:hypothetical protein